MEEGCRLQPVRDQCKKLWRDWEALMQNAESAASDLGSSCGAQEEALRTERAEVQSLQQEVETMRSSFLLQTQEQASKLLRKKRMANSISTNVQKELAEVKSLQGQLAQQLKHLRLLIADVRDHKRDDILCREIRSRTSQGDTNHGAEEGFASKRAEVDMPHLSPQHNFIESSLGMQEEEVDKDSSRHVHILGSSSSGSGEPCIPLGGHLLVADNSGPSSQKVKVESDVNDVQSTDFGRDFSHSKEAACKKQVSHFAGEPMIKGKTEQEDWTFFDSSPRKINYDNAETGNVDLLDELDHVPLSDRLELLIERRRSEKELTHGEVMDDTEYHDTEYQNPHFKEGVWQDAVKKKSSQKRTDVPIEIALQEDAPGLLEKLQEKGLMEDMVVYNPFDGNDCGFSYDQFTDLESIVSKLWGTSTGLFKVPIMIKQHAGLNKGPSYCVACLVSLIEQARSLRLRNWPVEWGWSRELQAFLFVFEKHNRIVLERPEYGNATYFFELVQPISVQWQVRRLIRVLSVTALGKSALLENRPLQLGDDLMMDEAKILEGYGWTKNMGLGSFLNFCDRVVHDIRDDDNAEWRQKIGKCLMDGHDKGRISMWNIPQNADMEIEVAELHNSELDEDEKPNIWIELNHASI